MTDTTQTPAEPTLQDHIKSLDGLPTGAKVNGLQAVCLMFAECVDPARLDALEERLAACEADSEEPAMPVQDPAPAPAPAA